MSQLIRDETGAQRLLGYVLDVARGDGRAACSLDLGPQHLNRTGILHGGIATAMLDNAMGATASLTVDETGRHPFSTITLTVNFLAPGRPGRIEALGQVTGGGRSTLFLDGVLTHQDGTVIARATGVFRKTRQG
ncbi:PaaI family thioesterase [Paracoccus sp. M683]|uniref:PaaI family thioesterase n=1 Tax=Paracoccus sp. M683 TaxID=2594268 RepID=UPI00117DE2B1|nr:PaaI family thioesterase [Paracoccus sp. M683]TRW99455.1 PaaI family thioesterase [Paracoccus sp. M683]